MRGADGGARIGRSGELRTQRPGRAVLLQPNELRSHSRTSDRSMGMSRLCQQSWLICTPERLTNEIKNGRAHSAGRNQARMQRLTNPVTLCDGHGVFLVAASGQLLMAAHTYRGKPANLMPCRLCGPLQNRPDGTFGLARWTDGPWRPTVTARCWLPRRPGRTSLTTTGSIA